MIDIKARNVRLRRIDTPEKACNLVVEFLASTEMKEELLRLFLHTICAKWNRTLTSQEMGRFRKRCGIAESTLHRLLTQLEQNELIRKVPNTSILGEKRYLYYLHENFAKALYRVVRAYRRRMLPLTRPRQ